MLRRISTKLVLAVLLAAVLPFVAFAFFLNEQMAERVTRHVVEQALLGLVKDLAGQIDYFVYERRVDLETWAEQPLTHLALSDHRTEAARLARGGEGDVGASQEAWRAPALARWARGELSTASFELEFQNRSALSAEFDRYLELKTVYDLLLLVSAEGRLVTCSTRNREEFLEEPFLEYLFAYDYRRTSWFGPALEGEFVPVDHHVSPFHLANERDQVLALDPAWDFGLGFATPVRSRARGDQERSPVRGVLYALVNWKHVQELVSTQVVTHTFRGLVREDREPSPYAWLWAADANRILAHRDRSLYYRRVKEDLNLGHLTTAVLADDDGWGLYPEYEFLGEKKNAAFHVCRPRTADGFGWVVGVGIDNDDIYATADELRRLLLGGTAVVLVLAVCLTLWIARRTTGPIRALQKEVRRVAGGDLDARIEVRTRDELGALAEDFNRMTAELKAQRERLIKAEKDAAWKEMARQIAHDIKNPLTPITLSLDLLARARRERPEGSEEILERTMGMMRRQVENLRQIAGDFYEFTGGRRAHPEPVALAGLLEEVLHLHDAWAVQRGISVQREGPDATVWADRGKLQRVFVNLASNALQAMPEGGSLFVSTEIEGAWAVVTFRDTGTGIAAEAQSHLFEPYFTTKSEGTGLGLAISRRSIEESGGEISLMNAVPGPGAVARVRLLLHRPGTG